MAILKRVMYGPCGKCKAMTPRDDLHSLNVKIFAPDDVEERVVLRLCRPCRTEVQASLEEMRRSNASMSSETVPLEMS